MSDIDMLFGGFLLTLICAVGLIFVSIHYRKKYEEIKKSIGGN